MVNNYNLEKELLNKSRLTDRSPKSIIGDVPSSDYSEKSDNKYSEETNENS